MIDSAATWHHSRRAGTPCAVTPVRIVETDAAFLLEDRDGRTLARSGSLTEMLEAARPRLGLPDRESVLRDSEWRWLDASREERAEDFPDGHIDATTIEELADSINRASMPVPVDGGAVAAGMLPSPVHGMARDSGTPANGWAHAGVPVLRADGSLHLYLHAELLPEIAAESDRGRIAFGSVLVEAARLDESGALRGAVLAGHALTNNPANRQLTPSTAVRGNVSALVMRAGATLLRSSIMAKRKPSEQVEIDATHEPINAIEAAPVLREDEPEEPRAEEAPPEDKDAKIAELEAKVADLTAQLEALMAESEARADGMPSEEELAEKEAAEREARAAEAVEAAIARGNLSASTREKWIPVARSRTPEEFAAMVKNLRAFPARQAKPAEAAKVSLRMLDKTDPFVVAMRAAGVSETEIERRIAARAKEI